MQCFHSQGTEIVLEKQDIIIYVYKTIYIINIYPIVNTFINVFALCYKFNSLHNA